MRDLNSPDESQTSLFFGMPLRSLMDAGRFGLLENRVPVSCDHVVHVGARDLDVAERDFIEDGDIRCIIYPLAGTSRLVGHPRKRSYLRSAGEERTMAHVDEQLAHDE